MDYTSATLALMAILVATPVIAQDSFQNKKYELDRIVTEIMRCADIHSLSLAIVSLDKSFLHVKGYGTYESSGKRQLDHTSTFCIGGATQAFTAVLLARLLEHNQNVTWNTPIQDILGRRIVLPEYYMSQHLNLKDILAMRSGLAGMDIVPVAKPYSAEKLVSNLRYTPRVAGFRDKFVYNEVLFSLINDVVKVLGGGSWHDLIKEHILTPLNMTSTIVLGPQYPTDRNFVKGHVYYNKTSFTLEKDNYSGLELVASAASLCTTAEDMYKWLLFLLNNGQTDNKVLIRKDALEATYMAIQSRGLDGDPVTQGYRQPQIPVSYSRDYNSLGWINGYYRGNLNQSMHL
uniref:Beta-lactamase-related domain-containing protein n=1 Tax=Arion vulgaris TaxID=1028688 RepID=A0A0B7A289_9EUPU